jgi:hypothetical protein
MVAHCLQLVDAQFAADQYHRAKDQLGRQSLGFGYAREWASPRSPREYTLRNGNKVDNRSSYAPDVDSGTVIPIVQASAGSSGMALIGAVSFHDEQFLHALLRTLEFAAFPVTKHDRLRFCASNQVGDAALLYALVQGPLWDRIIQMRGGTAP